MRWSIGIQFDFAAVSRRAFTGLIVRLKGRGVAVEALSLALSGPLETVECAGYSSHLDNERSHGRRPLRLQPHEPPGLHPSELDCAAHQPVRDAKPPVARAHLDAPDRLHVGVVHVGIFRLRANVVSAVGALTSSKPVARHTSATPHCLPASMVGGGNVDRSNYPGTLIGVQRDEVGSNLAIDTRAASLTICSHSVK